MRPGTHGLVVTTTIMIFRGYIGGYSLVSGRSHRTVPTPFVSIFDCNSEKSGGPSSIS